MTRGDRHARAHRVSASRAVGLFVFAAYACGAPSDPPEPSEPSEPATPSQPSTRLYPRPQGIDNPTSSWLPVTRGRDDLVERYGAPADVSARPIANRHDPSVIDSIVVVSYPAARYTWYVVTSSGGDALLDEAAIGSDAHLQPAAPRIGTPADSLRAWLGAPLVETDSTLEYDCLSCATPNPVTLVIEDGALRELRFDLYVD